jgi:hypothetical protein
MSTKHEPSAEKKALVDTLLAIDSRMPTSSAEGREVAKKVLRRDRRRVRILTWMTIGFFLLTVIGICFFVFLLYVKVVPAMNKCEQDLSELEQQLAKQEPQPSKHDLLTRTAGITAAEGYTFFLIHVITLRAIAALLAIMLAAAVSTVLLIMATRGATLHQIQASLLALSEQFDALQQSPQGGQSSGGGEAPQKPNGG